jgi:predicted MPP superfamily phosphohydrolase
MRTFQLLFIVLFIVFYVLITLGALNALVKISPSTNKRKIRWSIMVTSIFILFAFIALYIWPLTTRNTKDYTAHLIFNALLSVDFIFKIPLALSFIIGFFFSKRKRPILYFIGLILSLGMSISVVYGYFLGTKRLIINQVVLGVNNLPPSYDGLKLMQISDTHLGNFLASKKLMMKVQKETSKIDPDIVLFTGDLVNNFYNELIGWDEIFKSISQNRECFSILGNHDYGNYTTWDSEAEKIENFKQIESGHKTFGFRLLNNEHVKLKSGADSIYIVGVENWGHPPFPQYANIDKAMAGVPENTFKILMTHDPAHWDEVIKFRGDIGLTLSGHTHGMQWGFLRAGVAFSPSYFTRHYWGGLYKFNDSYLYVNTGLGTVGLPWRINMPAEITVLTLKRVEID